MVRAGDLIRSAAQLEIQRILFHYFQAAVEIKIIDCEHAKGAYTVNVTICQF